MTEQKTKTPIQLTEEIIKMLEMFINGHGFCLSIASAYSNSKSLHKSLIDTVTISKKEYDELSNKASAYDGCSK